MDMTKAAAALIAAGLLAGCAGAGGPGTVAADPETEADDSVAAETEAMDPMEPGAMQDSVGTQIPGS